MTKTNPKTLWMTPLLQVAGLYNLAFGIFAIVAPHAIFRWMGIPDPTYPSIWQCVGMIVGVYGIGYFIAALNPVRHWPIVLIGLLGKVLGPIGFVFVAWSGELPWNWVFVVLLNDVIWWLPFASILYYAFDKNCDTSKQNQRMTFDGVLRSVRNHRGSTIADLSESGPVMLVFLRHLGCTFCRETLSDLRNGRQKIEDTGIKLALVHMSTPMDATHKLEKHGLGDIHRFHDPNCALYEAFDIDRGNVVQLFGPKVWFRGLIAGFIGGHGMGKLAGDGFRMPGVFVIHQGKIVVEHRACSAADRPDYVRIAKSAQSQSSGNETPDLATDQSLSV